MKNSKVTIHHIAKELNIDSSTVSRALSDNSRVKQETKDIVNAKAIELGYQRNLLASNLRSKKTNTIGVIVPRISRYFFSSAIAGIEETAYDEGYSVIICQSLDYFEREKKIVQSLSANRVDGILMSISMETKDDESLQFLKKTDTPHVLFDRHLNIPGYSSVVIDDFQGGFDATEHLILQGCKNIAHFSGPQGLEIYKNRFLGYEAALKKHNIPLKNELIISSKLMEADGIENAKKLLSLNVPIDGIFSSNDTAAISALQYLKEKGIKIPQEIAIVGFSNEPISSVIDPSLTTIDQPGFEMGKIAMNLLLSRIKNKNEPKEAETIVLKTALLKRNSSKRIG
ncbi:LacI family DNA-binding transcriptional regulator [Flavobacterium gilvum]|uniref:LacI family transcriptional regulator n=1 Tax=Flavobacterium gilvum TaxID=1492737 RepID=A0AAC9I5S3_9FLAO|nr:LacI family DNA-binding transcriptional regulator [Flavobacterium gilvum]AOW10610.1 LacI family transcriptional regulator [Flavobacterium gilvum]